MVKYTEIEVVFEEIPDKISLAIAISNCPFRCKGCHSEYLRDDVGTLLTVEELKKLIERNKGVNCILFMGDGNDMEEICKLADFVKSNYSMVSTAIYSGYDTILPVYLKVFDYIKTGKYNENLGPISKKTTNQRLYRITNNTSTDITTLFWKEYEPKKN